MAGIGGGGGAGGKTQFTDSAALLTAGGEG